MVLGGELKIKYVKKPPILNIITFEISENAPLGSLVGIINAEDPQGGQLNLSINENEFFYLEGVSLK